MQCWTAKKLSQAGRVVMIKLVLQVIHTYVMNCFKFPEALITKMESLLAAFFWHQDVGKKIHWLAWWKVCRGKKEGCLGVQSLKEFNIALLCK
ncbi:hypothetical protein Sango_1268800 [Sesamum angolense]|uniref:Uncharacterized protein n=1 Tax=Sesamum angolense TaxID=2727404 RepID=A0AAE1WRJ6_9LAMI|nr:hypothetical protein Sango_1268800 [Sesamum angolense]